MLCLMTSRISMMQYLKLAKGITMVMSYVYTSDIIEGQNVVHVGNFDSCFAILNVCSRDNWQGRTAYLVYDGTERDDNYGRY